MKPLILVSKGAVIVVKGKSYPSCYGAGAEHPVFSCDVHYGTSLPPELALCEKAGQQLKTSAAAFGGKERLTDGSEQVQRRISIFVKNSQLGEGSSTLAAPLPCLV